MNNAMKKLFSLAFAFVFMAGLAHAQNNESVVTQNSSGSVATIDQVGLDNYSTLSQSEDFIGGHTATITQVGENNWSEIQTQNGGGTATVTMTGDNNSLVDWGKGRQRGGFGANQKNSLNDFSLDVTGSNNTVGMTQEFALGDVDIVGDGNQVGLRQLSGANYQVVDFHDATIDIEGNQNVFDVNQARLDGGTGGKRNVSTNDITGDLNMIGIEQFGSDNTSSLTVIGSANMGTVLQSGHNHTSTKTVTGSGNMISVTQTDAP